MRGTQGLRIAMVGLRGLPATYGGIERHVEEIGARLVAAGHRVEAFCRPHYTDAGLSEHRGITLRTLPAPRARGVEAFVHSGLSSLATLGNQYDVVHFHAIGPGLFTPLPRYLSSAAVVHTIHGMDDERAKWGGGARAVLRAGRWVATRVPHATITVSRTLRQLFRDAHDRESTFVPNGCPPVTKLPPDEITTRFGLAGDDYLLFVGRLVPEKAPDQLIRAFRDVRTDTKLVIVGGSSHTDEYAATLQELAASDDRVVLTGYLYGDVLAELFSNALVYVQPSLLEGMPLTLLEAIAYERAVIASDIGPHMEVLCNGGRGGPVVPMGQRATLTEALQRLVDSPEQTLRAGKDLAEQVRPRYNWDDIAQRTLATYHRALRTRSRTRGRGTHRLPMNAPAAEEGAHVPERG